MNSFDEAQTLKMTQNAGRDGPIHRFGDHFLICKQFSQTPIVNKQCAQSARVTQGEIRPFGESWHICPLFIDAELNDECIY